MPKIEGFRVRNFRALKDVTLGKLWNLQDAEPLSPLTVVIGQNGVGKSSLFDAFGFLADCLRNGVEEACDMRGRGGFARTRSKGQEGPIEFEVYYKQDGNNRPITYELSIDLDSHGRPYAAKERLRQRRKNQTSGRPFSFLWMDEGKGVVWKGESKGQQLDESQAKVNVGKLIESAEKESAETEIVQLEDPRRLGIATLGSLKQHPRIAAFRRFIEGW